MEENLNEKQSKYSQVTGEKIKQKRLRKLKNEHKKQAKKDEELEKKLSKRKKKVDKKLNKKVVTVESKTVSREDLIVGKNNEVNEQAVKEMGAQGIAQEVKHEVLVVRRAEKGRPATRKRKFMNLLSYALVGFVAIFFGYISGNFYVANYLNNVDYGAFSEATLKDDAKAVYEAVMANGIMNSSAGELFVASEYVLNSQDYYYATKVGAIQPSIGSKQDVWGYTKKEGSVYESESASKGMLALAEKYFYDLNTQKATIYKASKVSNDSASYPENPTWEMGVDAYKEEYGVDPDAPSVPYIISSKTVLEGTEKVVDLGGGKYQISFMLTTDSSVINYVKQVKHMSGLQGYPTFKMISVTAVIDSYLQFSSIRFDESYSVMYFGVMATCTGFVESEFTY